MLSLEICKLQNEWPKKHHMKPLESVLKLKKKKKKFHGGGLKETLLSSKLLEIYVAAPSSGSPNPDNSAEMATSRIWLVKNIFSLLLGFVMYH